jgi:7-cyano-7-deazaguanine synthase in queuosine biosynthesis
MELNCKKTENGFAIECKNRNFHLSYPKNIWKTYPDNVKEVLFENLAHFLTINLPLVAGIKKLKYNTSNPLFKTFFDSVVINSLPGAVEDYKIQTQDLIKHFLETDYEFNGTETTLPSYNGFELNERAIVTLSCGKDSLLSLAVCNEIGLNPVAVYINDTVSAIENDIKKDSGRKLCRENGIEFYIVENEIERLNDFEFWKNVESLVGYTHMVTSFCLIALPFSHYFKAKYIVEGNQKNMEFRFKNKDGFLTYPSFDQSIRWMEEQDKLVKMMTDKKANLISVIEPLTNIAIMRILHKRYKSFGKYEISCDDLYGTKEKRWCHNCSKCARLSLLMKANGIDIKTVGFRRNFFTNNDKNLYCLFKGKKVGCYEKSDEARDEQLLAFYMAYRNGEKGYLIDLFKKEFLEEAKSREDELIKKFFSIHKTITIPRNLEKKIFSIYKEELTDLF